MTHSQLVPTMFSRMLKLPAEVRSRYDLSSLEIAIHAGAPCPVQVKRQMIDWWGPIFLEYYASTDCPRGQEQLGADLQVGPAVAGHPRSLTSPRGTADRRLRAQGGPAHRPVLRCPAPSRPMEKSVQLVRTASRGLS